MKARILCTVLVALLMPIITSAQLITSSQMITTEKSYMQQVKPGYEQSIEFSPATNFYKRHVFALEYIGGMRFSNLFFLGAGIGLNFQSYSDDLYTVKTKPYENLFAVPLYIHTRFYFTHTRCQPFLALSIGGQVTTYKKMKDYDNGYNPSCFMASTVLGLNYRLNDNISLYFTLGCLLRNVVNYTHFVKETDNLITHRVFDDVIEDGMALKLGLGVTF